MSHRPDNARALAAAGADPWRPLIGGWSPGRLGPAGPTPDLFVVPEGERGLTGAEHALAEEGRRLVAALADIDDYDGTGLACGAGIDAQEAVRRLEATPAEDEGLDELLDDPYAWDTDDIARVVGVTTVPGGCVVTQPWGYAPQMPGVQIPLSAGTVCYGMYTNPKSGDHRAATTAPRGRPRSGGRRVSRRRPSRGRRPGCRRAATGTRRRAVRRRAGRRRERWVRRAPRRADPSASRRPPPRAAVTAR